MGPSEQGPGPLLGALAGGSGVLEIDRLFEYRYDPSNGTISAGNIVIADP